MPELPEVETIRRGLQMAICGRTIKQIIVRNPNLRVRVNKQNLNQAVNRSITAINRRAKYLLFKLDDEAHLLIHLGMSGRVSLTRSTDTLLKHDHLIFTFNCDLELRYNDTRRFGLVQYIEPGHLEECQFISKLGPEPLGEDFTVGYLSQKAINRTLPVKKFLMDSRIVVGLGNIYVNEVLFSAGISPLRPAGEITLKEWKNLRNVIRRVLRNAIRLGGTTLADGQYRNVSGELGYFQQTLKVYDRENQQCYNCSENIVRTTLSGRSTYTCKNCQR